MTIENHFNLILNARVKLYKGSKHFSHLSESALTAAITEEMKSLEELAMPDVALKRHEFFSVPHAAPEDYYERVIEIEPSSGQYFIAGIRFRNLELNRPFITIMPSFSELDEGLILKLSRKIKSEFKVFNPESFHFTMPEDVTCNAKALKIDRFTVVESIENLDLSSANLKLTPLKSIEFYNEYVEEYEHLYRTSTHLRSEVRIEDLASLNEAGQLGLMYKLEIDGEVGGLIAGFIQNYYGQEAVCILEEIIFAKHRGKGLGVFLQKSFAKEMQPRFNVLWGQISELNKASLKTAQRVGRKITEVEYVHPLNL